MTMASIQMKYVAPTVYPETQKYWEAAAEGRLLVKRCQDCGEHHHYPRSSCPFCFSERTEWREASGGGTIYSYSVMRRAAVPYAIAYVTLAEGPTMMTNIVDCDFDRLRVGQAVKLTVRDSEGGPPLPVFAPD
jgi:uncharacterized OB-fold protein